MTKANGRHPDPTFDAEPPRGARERSAASPRGLGSRWHDGRNVAPDLGALAGEGALQRVRDRGPIADRDRPEPGEVSLAEPTEGEGRSYYGLPVLKEPVWRWYIPAYFFTGGLAGACGVLGAAAQLAGGRGTDALVRRCRLAATAAIGTSAALLIADLGRPSRFIYMLRVFRPTSPMNMGTWIVTAFGGAASLAALPAAWPRAPRALLRAGDAAGLAAGLVGLPLVGYTGVLIADTAVPVWQGTHNTLPILFAFSGAVSAGALLQLWGPFGRRERAAGELVLRFGRIAKAAELAVSFALDREAASHAPRVARPLHDGLSGTMLRAARALVAASLVADLWPRRRRGGLLRTLSGALAMTGTLLLRFGVMQAGRASARDPHASFEMQRRGHGGAEEAKNRGVARMPSLPGVEATGKESFHEGPGV